MSLIKEREFNQSIGLFGLVALGVGATVGAGIFVLLGEATVLTGASVVLAFALNFFLALIIAFHYAEMAALSPVEGGGYSFIEEAFGPPAYFVGWLIWLGNIAYSSFCSLAFSLYVTSGTSIPAIPVAIVTLTVFSIVNLSGVSSVVSVEKFLTVLLVGIFAFFIIKGGGNPNFSNFSPLLLNGWGGLLPATSLVFLCYIGFETITTVSAEVKKPKTNIPRALILSVIFAGVLYTSFSFVFVGAVNPATITEPETSLLHFFETSRMKSLLLFASILATLSSLNIGLMAASRNAYALSRDGFLPKRFSKLSDNDSPYYALIISSLLSVVLLASGTARTVASVSDFSYMLVVSMVCLSVVALRRKLTGKEGAKRFFKVPLYPVLSVIGFALPLLLIIFLENLAILIGVAWIIIGFAFFLTWHSEAFHKELGKPKKS